MLHIKRHIPLAQYTTFDIGGMADFFVEVATAWELTEALDYARDNHIPTFVFSGGSNILFSDQGFAGLVVRLSNHTLRVQGETLLADAGATLFDAVKLAVDKELSGLERLAGIPGSVGGAIRGNAGAFGCDIGSIISTVKCYDRKREMIRELHQKDCHFQYRTSRFKESPELVILSAVLRLKHGQKDELEKIMNDTVALRESKHPQSAKCAGSFFMNPTVNSEHLLREFEKDTGATSKDGKLPAGWLIDHVGLRGKRIGQAMISDKHPNYFVNIGGAKAEDIVMLASLAKQRVRDELHIQLKEEVQYVGF